MVTPDRLEQKQLPNFPVVARPDRMRHIRPWRGIGFEIGDWQIVTRVIERGSKASGVVAAFLHAHPYIERVSVGRVDYRNDFPYIPGYKVKHPRNENTDLLSKRISALNGNPKYSRSTGVALLSDVILDDGTKAHIPMMRFGKFTDPERILSDMGEEHPGFVLQDGFRGYYFMGSGLIPESKWPEFMRATAWNATSADIGYIEASVVGGRSFMRVLPIGDFAPEEPEVTAISAWPS